MITEGNTNKKDLMGITAIILISLNWLTAIVQYFIQTLSNGENIAILNIFLSLISLIIPVVLILLRNKNKTLFIICNILLALRLISILLSPLTSVFLIPTYLISSFSYFVHVLEIFIKSWGNSALTIIGLILVMVDTIKKIKSKNK